LPTTVASLVVRISASVTEFEKAMAGMEKKWSRQGAKFQQIGRDLTTGLTLPIVAVGGLAVKAASDFESSFAGVKKTVNATAPEFAQLAAGIRKMATEIPVGVNELNKIAELGGQLGIETGNILDFTRVIADMGVTTSLSTEEAAMGMAQFASMTQMSQKDFGRLGSTIVALGNDMATTEPKILDFALRIGAVGKSVGLTQAEIVGLSAAMAAVGIEAEMGGTAVSKALQSMNMAAQTGKGTGVFGAAAGMSGDAFAKLFDKSPMEGLQKVMEGVGAAGKMGAPMLKALGFDDARQVTAFMSLAGAGHKLRDAIALANKEWERGKALSEEAAIRYGTFASQMTIFKNRLQDVAISAGQSLIPALQRMMPMLETLIGALATAVNWFSKLPTSLQLGAFGFAGFVAAIGPASFAIGTLIKTGAGIAGLFSKIAFAPVVSGFTSVATAIGGIGMALLAIGGPLAAYVGAMLTIDKIGKSDTFQRWLATSNQMEAKMLRTGFNALGYIPTQGAITEAQYEAARNQAAGSGMSGMISPAGAERTDPQERLAAQLAEANQRALNPQLFAKADAERMKLVEAAQRAEEVAKQAQQAEEQRLESIASLRRDLTGATAIAAAVEMQAALQGVNLSKLEVEERTRVNDVLAKGIKLIGEKAPQAMREMASATMPRLDEVGDQVRNITSLYNDMSENMREASMVNEPLPVFELLPSAEENLSNIASLTDTVTDNLKAMSDVKPPSQWAGFFSPQGLQQMADILYRLANDFGGTAGNVIGGIGGIVGSIGAYQQNGMPKGAMGKMGALANMAGAIWGSTEAGGGKGMNALSGAMSGAAMGMAFGPVGAAWGATAGALVGWAKSMMVSKEEKSAREEALAFQNELIAKFAETATAAQLAEGQGERWRVVNIAVRDAYLAIGKSEAEAMADLEKFNNATRQSAEAVQAAAGVIAQAFEEQAADVARLDEAVKRYGFTFEELGSKLQNKNSLAAGKELIEDWRVLTQAGIGVETVNARMGESMATYLQTALSVGAEVPAAMKPILEMMAQQGVLMDAAGNGFSTLEGLSVNWSETLTQGFDRVIVKLDQLINSLIAAGTAISPLDGSVVAAAGGAGASATPAPLTGLGLYHGWQEYLKAQGKDGVFMMIEAQKHATAGDPIPAMAKGGIVRRPTFAMIGEAGPEAVVPLDGDQSGVGGFHLHGPITVVANNAEEFAASLIKVVRRNTGSARTSLRNLMPRPA
jgi:TP901 family phage tail tape measure protein